MAPRVAMFMAVTHLDPLAMVFYFFPMAMAMIMAMTASTDNNGNAGVSCGCGGGKAYNHRTSGGYCEYGFPKRHVVLHNS